MDGLVFNGEGVGPRDPPTLMKDRAQSVRDFPSGGEPPGVLDVSKFGNVEGDEAEGINGRLRGGGGCEGPRRACGGSGRAVVALGKKGPGSMDGGCRCCCRGAAAAIIFVEHQAASFDKKEGWRRRHGLVVMGLGCSDSDDGTTAKQGGEEVDFRVPGALCCMSE